MERDRRVWFWIVLIGTLALDQVVKAWVRGHLAEHESPGFPWPGVFEITLNYNTGVAFGKLAGRGVWMAPIAIGIAGMAIFHAMKHPKDSRWTMTLAALMASGALGNLYDRVFLNRVTDMFWFRPINFPVFNVADICITVATIMLLISWLRESGKHEPARASAPGATEPEGTA